MEKAAACLERRGLAWIQGCIYFVLIVVITSTDSPAQHSTALSNAAEQPKDWIHSIRSLSSSDETVFRYRFRHHDVPVYGIEFKIPVTTSFSADRMPVPSVSFSESRDPVQDVRKIRTSEFIPSGWVFMEEPELVWYPVGTTYQLVYIATGHMAHDLMRMQLVLDAATGTLIHSTYAVCMLDTVGTANTIYYGSKPIHTSCHAGLYSLKNSSKGDGIETYNLGYQLHYNGISEYTDSDNNWNNGEPVQAGHAADAHYGATAFYDYLNTTFGRNSLDGQGMKLVSYMNYGTNFVNAFWNGNAVVYGSGTSQSGPMTTIDITGHEFAHGLIQEITGLHANGEPGILQESLADMIGTAFEHYEGSSAFDWLIGEDNGNPVRSMSDPRQFNHPDTYLGDHWYYGNGDNGGVHINCGFLNKWFYLIAAGGSGNNDLGYAYAVQGIGIDSAIQLVYSVMERYVVPMTTFSEFMSYTIEESISRYGACSNETDAIVEAWKAVGLYTDPVTGLLPVTPGPYCEGDTVFLSVSGAVYSGFAIFNNGVQLNPIMIGNRFAVTTSGNYQVSENRCGLIFQSTPVQITFAQRTVVQVSDYQTCEGVSLSLAATPSGGIFNVPNPYSGPTVSATYTYVNQEGCTSVSTFNITVRPAPDATIFTPSQMLFRDDTPLSLSTASAGGYWTGVGIRNDRFNPLLAGPGNHVVIYQMTDNNGCTGTDSIIISVSEACRPFEENIEIRGAENPVFADATVTLSVSEEMSGHTCRWVLPEGVIPVSSLSASQIQVLWNDQPGTVTAEIINGCGERKYVTAAIHVIQEQPSVLIYPIPAQGNVTIETDHFPSGGSGYLITDSKGTMVTSGKVTSDRNTIVLNGLSPGIYMVRFTEATVTPLRILISENP